MKKFISFLAMTLGFFSPIELMIIILMSTILLDTIVKMFSIRKIAIENNRKFRDVFRSKSLREGYIWKSLGYLVIACAIFPLDYYVLTPFVIGAVEYFNVSITIPTQAVFTNLLLVIFCLMEISSINENWYDITGDNMFAKVAKMIKKIRFGFEETYRFIRKTKEE